MGEFPSIVGRASFVMGGISVTLGVPYPPQPAAGSNGIGTFALGASQLGDISQLDVWQTVLDQYANSPVITSTISSLFSAIDQTGNIDDFFDKVLNINTATGYGLQVLGRIVGISNVIPYTVIPASFGFSQATGSLTFGEGAFYSGATSTTNYTVSDDVYRLLIKAKAAANISNGSILSLNNILSILFPNRGNAYVTDDGNMSMTYTFLFALSPIEVAIVTQSGVLPVPSGVSCTYVHL